MDLSQAEKFGITLLSKNKNIKTLNLDAQILLAFVIQKNREFIITHNNAKLTNSQFKKYHKLINDRLKNIPLPYLVGKKEFYSLEFKVNKNTLIPRPETEMMVDEVINLVKKTPSQIIIDIGTGTGCIPISIAKNSNIMNFYAIDTSKKALVVAKNNAKLHRINKKIKFLHGNLLDPITKNSKYIKPLINPNKTIIITANLPYLTPTQIKNSPTIQKEPKLALSAGQDGLKYYKILFKQLKTLTKIGIKPTILCEIDPSQKNSISNLIKKEIPNSRFIIKNDLEDRPRLVIISI